MEVSNVKAMREALEYCLDFIMRLDRGFNPFMQNLLENATAKAQAALDEPPRNCDVGTAEEQTRRMENEYCRFQKGCCELLSGEHCPLYRTGIDCQLAWAQMPYKKEGAK